MRSSSALVGLILWCAWGAALAAGTFYVQGTHPACSDTGPGTESVPYCRISPAATARGGPGTTLLVKPGTYREQVTVPASGSAGAPFIFQAVGSGVVVDGADDFSSPALWSPIGNGVYLASSVTWPAKQVFVDGARILPSTLPPQSIPVNTFRMVDTEGLYVNIGGANPGTRQLLVGRRNNGFRVAGRSWVTIQGFEVRRTEDRAIYFLTSCSDVVASGNNVAMSLASGIAVVTCTRATITGNVVADATRHGIYLLTGTTDSVVRGNESLRSIRFDGVGVAGIKIEDSPNNLVEGNSVHHNQDSGLQINTSNDVLARHNVSWSNGDHGYDHLGSLRTVHMSEVAYGNRNDGYSFEGVSTDGRLFNSISVDNGLTTGRYNLFVDSGSIPGFDSDYDILWNSTGVAPVRIVNTVYATLVDLFAATGLEGEGILANPIFANPALGSFMPLAGSPAIDSADASAAGWSSLDGLGRTRVDDPNSTNQGTGTPPFGDRGALEFWGNCNAGAGPSPETCDGLDNNCNGTIDDVPLPALVTNLQRGLTSMTWSPLIGATAYQVVRGSLEDLDAGNFVGSTKVCLAPAHPSTTLNDPAQPASAKGFWYLVRGDNCTGPGSYNSGSPTQQGSRDAGIAASGHDCP